MCILHPKNKKITLFHDDFENYELLKSIGTFDITISSSALQWAYDLKSLLKNISNITDEIAFAIFCDNTFKTIYEMTDIENFLPSVDTLLKLLDNYYDYSYEVKNYKLYFDDNLSKFRYIKQSGVSGGKKRLCYRDTKTLIENYPHDYLEFEVVFIKGRVIAAPRN